MPYPTSITIQVDDEVELQILADAHRQIGDWRAAIASRRQRDFDLLRAQLNPPAPEPSMRVAFPRPKYAGGDEPYREDRVKDQRASDEGTF